MATLRNQSGWLIAILAVVIIELISYRQGINALSVLVPGLALGGLYALIALGYSMVYGIIELINFAHGDVFAVGAFVSLTFMEHADSAMVSNGGYSEGAHTVNILGHTAHVDVIWITIWVLLASMALAAIVCAVLGVLIERIAYRPLRNAPRLAPLITAIGVSYILENLLLQWRGGVILAYPTVMPILSKQLFGTLIHNTDLFVIVAAVVVMLALDRFINQTTMGKAMRAVAQDREAALMMGINVDRIISLTFFIGSAIAGIGAVIYGVYQGGIGSNMGFTLGLFAFTAAVLGGIGNIRGAMVGGFLIGLIQRFVDSLGSGVGTEWSDIVVFAVLILVLVFRPSGLFGTQIPEKV